MSSEVAICNIALSHVGTQSTISALDENSNEARQCNIHYKDARDFVLRIHPWGFAEKRIALADLDAAPIDWAYRYGYPSDCVNALEIVPDDRKTSEPSPFKVAVSDDLNSRTILADKASAYLRYTARVTNPLVFDAAFVQTLGWYMGTLIAIPLTGSREIRREMVAGFQFALADAATADGNESDRDEQREAEWTTARN